MAYEDSETKRLKRTIWDIIPTPGGDINSQLMMCGYADLENGWRENKTLNVFAT